MAASSLNTATIGALGVALLIGLVGPIILWANTGKTLEAERKRLDATLEAEDKRHRDQLSFDRGQTDRAEMRRILDALAEHLFLMIEEVAATIPRVEYRSGDDDVDEDLAAIWRRELREGEVRLQAELDEIARQVQRADLRLGSEGQPIRELALRMRQQGQMVGVLLSGFGGVKADDLAGARVAQARLGPLVGEFLTEALKFTAAQLHSDPTPS